MVVIDFELIYQIYRSPEITFYFRRKIKNTRVKTGQQLMNVINEYIFQQLLLFRLSFCPPLPIQPTHSYRKMC
jgi:hypothetical protein